MKRKVIKLATNTLVVSLPSKWAQRHGVKKGDELEIEEIGHSLKVLAASEATEGATTVRIRNKDPFLRRLVDNPYRMGYDEVRIEYDDPSIYHKVQDEINNLMGYEIIRQGPGYCIARNIAQGIESEFQASLNRLFLVTLQFQEDLHAALLDPGNADLSVISQTEGITNRLAHFCKRMLNLERAPNPIRSRSTYRIVCILEEVGDLLKKACVHIEKEKPVISNETPLYLASIIEQFRLLYKLHNRYDPDLMAEYGSLEKKNEKLGQDLATVPSEEAYVQMLFAFIVEEQKHLSEEISP